MTRDSLFGQIVKKRSFLCVGLDTDLQRIPSHLKQSEDPIFEFNKTIIDATHDLAVAYKPNVAFYEAMGPAGMSSLQKTIDYIPEDIMVIADAKRGDIGNTSHLYARAFFDYYKADAVTIAPYMGSDSVKPFLQHEGKWAIILTLTSNIGSEDFQKLKLGNGKHLYEEVVSKIHTYGSPDNIMLVVGATQGSYIKHVRDLAPEHFFLVPGVGAQGGSLEEVCRFGMNDKVGLLVNSSRGIIYASSGNDFGLKAREAALDLRNRMSELLPY